jgi:hypothetical protein
MVNDMNKVVKSTIIIGIVFILMMISIVSIQASENKKDAFPQKTLASSENILANISLSWDSFFHKFSLKDLDPIVVINQSSVKDFYFPEINGTIPNINFTVVCQHRLLNPVLIPRFTRVYIAISYNDTYILLNESINHRCKSLEWEYINFTVESNNQFIPLITNGENITLTVEVGAYYFFFRYWGVIEMLDPITVHPIPTQL